MIRAGANAYEEASFSFGNKLGRLIWSLTYYLLFRFSPRPFHRYRASLLKIFGARLGRGCHIYPSAKIWAPWNLTMDDQACIANNVNCYNQGPVTLGKKVVVSQGAHLCTGSHDYNSENFQLFTKPIVIGDMAWVCTEAFVGPGVTLGEGAVVGARSVVTKDLPAWMVSVGMPAVPVKPRARL